jgi:uncharacterized protein YegL
MEQNPFLQEAGQQRFADNPEPRCPSLLILDVSGSMQGAPLRQLQEGIEVYRDCLHSDALARQRVEVAILTFGGKVELICPFATVDAFSIPRLESRGDTPMGQAVVEGLSLLDSQKSIYKQNGIAYYRPWVFLLTDGGPTDVDTPYWPEAKQRVKEGENKKSFSFFAVGVEGADMQRLGEISVREPLKLKGLEFRKMFEWLSASQQAVSRSTPGDTVKLETPVGWAQI